VAFGEANNFESEFQLFEPLCIVITHVLTTTWDTAVTEIPERRLFRKLHMLSFFCCRTSNKIVEYVEVSLARGGTRYPRLKQTYPITVSTRQRYSPQLLEDQLKAFQGRF
jgi:hypothetical protein